ncbi:DGQHR domain-containing protein [Methanoculleus bourgensis]|uniref:DGQHR domain-containing protein n=1 Tax=Methanoculleus bourgensis TaxID=83986 RepID=UPI001BDA1C62|nr:DGQHR domain-containing protein [Methanoculleus bourgensis]MBT0733710.1 DGQHR domain-containing protein [Methanoculleus bourgensis]
MKNLISEGQGLTVEDSNMIELIDQYRRHAINPSECLSKTWEDILGKCYIEIPVLQAQQTIITLYLGKIRAYELLLLSSVDQWTESNCDGYQRSQYKSRNREIKDYLKECPIPLIPSILGSVKEAEFLSKNGPFGALRIPILPGAISLLDGQQRTGGFEELFLEYKDYIKKNPADIDTEEINKYYELFNFEIPIVLIDSPTIATRMRHNGSDLLEIGPDDIERAFFIIINKTQKAVNASLKDELLYKTIEAGIRGIPAIEKEVWRAEVVPIANSLNDEEGPLHGLINLGGISGLKKPIQLNGFVTSLKTLFVSNEYFCDLEYLDKNKFLHVYWETIRDMFPETFEQQTIENYLLTKSIGIYSLNYLASDVFQYCYENQLNPYMKENIHDYLAPLRGFDWTKESSPFAYLGGKKGVRKAKEILQDFMQNGSCN